MTYIFFMTNMHFNNKGGLHTIIAVYISQSIHSKILCNSYAFSFVMLDLSLINLNNTFLVFIF